MNRVPFLQFLGNQTERYKQATQKGIKGKKVRSINRLLVAQSNQRFEFHRHGETKKLKLNMNSEKIINEEERKRKSKKFKNR